MSYEIVFIDEILKKSIIQKFLDSSSDQLSVKILRQLKYLQVFGINHANPNLKKLTNTSFWEIRILGKENIRIFCFQLKSSQILIVHIFHKKTNKTPLKEIRLAQYLLEKVLDI